MEPHCLSDLSLTYYSFRLSRAIVIYAVVAQFFSHWFMWLQEGKDRLMFLYQTASYFDSEQGI